MAETSGAQEVFFLSNHRDRGITHYAGTTYTLIESKAKRVLEFRTDEGEPVAREAKSGEAADVQVGDTGETASSLERLSRAELDQKAEAAGVENPATMANKGEVIGALVEKEAT